jgi:hypothetical protein
MDHIEVTKAILILCYNIYWLRNTDHVTYQLKFQRHSAHVIYLPVKQHLYSYHRRKDCQKTC